MTVITEYTRGSVEASHAAVEVPGTDGVRLVLSYPATDDYLWDEYLSGAWESYRRHGAQAALDVPAVRDGVSTSLFYALVDGDGVVVGGVRAARRMAPFAGLEPAASGFGDRRSSDMS